MHGLAADRRQRPALDALGATLTILKNQNLIAINQDSLGLQATQVSNDGTRRVLAKRLANGDVAVALFNQGCSTTHGLAPPRRRSARAAARSRCGTPGPTRPRPPPGRSPPACPAHGTVVYRVSGGGTAPPPTTAAFRLRSAAVRALPRRDRRQHRQRHAAVIWDCNGGANQRWTVRTARRCRSSASAWTRRRTRSPAPRCRSGTATAAPTSSGRSTPTARSAAPQSGLCLDVNGNATANGTAVHPRGPATARANQRWTQA